MIRGIERGENLKSICNGEKPVEVVVPFYRNLENSMEAKINTKISNNINGSNGFSPFENWLFYKIYCSNENEEEIIKFVNYFTEELSVNLPVITTYFMRYSDPLPHIRLRIKAEKPHIFEIAERFNHFIAPLQHSRLVSKYIIDTYYPENERYGGQELMPLAEQIFQIDSKVVVKLMDIVEHKEEIGVVSVLHYLNSFGITFEKQIELLEASVGNDNFTSDFKDIKNDYINLLDSYNHWETFKKDKKSRKFIELMDLRQNAIQEYAKLLRESDSLTNYLEDIILSVIHLHCNRLFGTDREFERKIYFFALHTLKGQRYKRKMMIENEKNNQK